MIRYEHAIACWKELLGTTCVITDPVVCDEKTASCLPDSHSARAIIRPCSASQIPEVCRIANDNGIAIYPVSRGRNWGYGSAAPSAENLVLLDLAELNKIVELNTELAYAVIEPGVTQGQLYQYLTDNNIPLCFDVSGAPPGASLLGNVLERGYGQTPYSDHFLFSCAMEVVLANGEIVRTGFGHYENAKAQYLYKWGLGPFLDGLFTQSNFGIVTKVCIWLMPKPEYFGVFHFAVRDTEHLCTVMERLRTLRLEGTFRSAVHLGNDIRVLSALQQYPWEEAEGKVPISDALKSRLLRQWGAAPWNCAGGLRGDKREVQARLRRIRRVLKGVARVHFMSDSVLSKLAPFAPLYQRLFGVDVRQKLAIFGLMKGIPTERPTQGVYWRKREKSRTKDFNPPADRCGVIWCAPIFPLTAEDTRQVVSTVERVCEKFHFEPNMSLNLVTPRAACAVIGIFFDKEIEEERELANACHKELLDTLIASGYFPYRMSSQAADQFPQLFSSDDPYWDTCRRIKQVLDPRGIFSPGRYGL